MNEQQWVIGADPSADVWLDHPDVSGFHCRVTETESGFTLEDLNSTNGTFSNGQPVASAMVSETDDVRLASVPIPWPVRRIAQHVIAIGYNPENQCRLNHDSVSGRHAELIVDRNGHFLLRDLGSTNGTWIGQRSVRVAVLKSADTFRVGLVNLTPQQVLKKAGVSSQNQIPDDESNVEKETASAGAMAVLLAIPVAALLLLLFLMFRSMSDTSASTSTPTVLAQSANPGGQGEGGTETPGESPPAASQSDASQSDASQSPVPGASGGNTQGGGSSSDTTEGPKIGSAGVSGIDANSTGDPSSNEPADSRTDLELTNVIGEQPSAVPPPKGLEAVANATYLLTVKYEGFQFDFATAWAIAPDVLITNARVIDSIRANGYKVSAFHMKSGVEVAISDTGYHPKYEKMRDRLQEVGKQIEQQLGQAEAANEASRPRAEIDALLKRVAELKQKAPWIERAADAYDVAWIRLVSKSTSHSCLKPKSIPVTKNKILRLASTLIEREAAHFDPADQRDVDFVRMRAGEMVLNDDTSLPMRMHAIFDSGKSDDFVFDGCAIVDLRGRLVGMYRGPARNLVANAEGPSESDSIQRIDMVAVNEINETLESVSSRTSQ